MDEVNDPKQPSFECEAGCGKRWEFPYEAAECAASHPKVTEEKRGPYGGWCIWHPAHGLYSARCEHDEVSAWETYLGSQCTSSLPRTVIAELLQAIAKGWKPVRVDVTLS